MINNEFTKDSLSENKPIPGAISAEFTDQISKVLAFGAAKYGRDNWAQCSKEQLFLYEDALLRHINAYRMGEVNDKETNLNHLAHAACNLMFLFELNIRRKIMKYELVKPFDKNLGNGLNVGDQIDVIERDGNYLVGDIFEVDKTILKEHFKNLEMNVNSEILYEGPLKQLYNKLIDNDIIEVRGHKTVELLNATITFDGSETGIINIKDIFKTSENYIEHETIWYESQNPHNEYIKQYAQIWSTASDDKGMTNSNYGFLMFSPQNGYQFENVVKELKIDKFSRRAVAYYTNPFMHYVGGNDHVCTMYVSYTVRDDKLQAIVSMRSNDIRFGLIGADLEWQRYMLNKIANEVGLDVGDIHWHAASLHLYERHFEQLKEIYKEGK